MGHEFYWHTLFVESQSRWRIRGFIMWLQPPLKDYMSPALILIKITILSNRKKSALLEAKVLTRRTGNKKRELIEKCIRKPLARLPSAWIASTATAMLTSVISCIDNIEVYIIDCRGNQWKNWYRSLLINVSTKNQKITKTYWCRYDQHLPS